MALGWALAELQATASLWDEPRGQRWLIRKGPNLLELSIWRCSLELCHGSPLHTHPMQKMR